MELVIVSPLRTLYSAEVDKVSFPGSIGTFTVLTGHAPLISSLRKGTIVYSSNGRQLSTDIKSGVVKVLNNKITACVETDSVSKDNEKGEK